MDPEVLMFCGWLGENSSERWGAGCGGLGEGGVGLEGGWKLGAGGCRIFRNH